MYTVRAKNQKPKSKCQVPSFSSGVLRTRYLPIVGAVLGWPAPLRLVALSIAGWLGLATTGLHVTTGHVATCGLWAGAVATTSSSGEWRVRAVVAAGARREWRVRSVPVPVTGWRGGGSVSDNHSRSLAIAKSDCRSLSGAGLRA
jgi:hypothetical protein